MLIKVKQKKDLITVFLAPTSRMTDRGLTAEMITKDTPVQHIYNSSTGEVFGAAKISAVVSILVWVAVIACGRLLAY